LRADEDTGADAGASGAGTAEAGGELVVCPQAPVGRPLSENAKTRPARAATRG
jgi:hypothetical protein